MSEILSDNELRREVFSKTSVKLVDTRPLTLDEIHEAYELMRRAEIE